MSMTLSVLDLSSGMFELSPPNAHIVVILTCKKPSLLFFVQIIKAKINDVHQDKSL